MILELSGGLHREAEQEVRDKIHLIGCKKHLDFETEFKPGGAYAEAPNPWITNVFSTAGDGVEDVVGPMVNRPVLVHGYWRPARSGARAFYLSDIELSDGEL